MSLRADHADRITTGIRLMPFTKSDRIRSTGPRISIDRSRGSSSWKRIFVSRRARCAPRQKCGPPGPNVTWSFGVLVTSNR